MIVDVKMCKKPAGAEEHEFYFKPTWLVMPKCEGLRLQLERQCPGLSDEHKHIRVGGYNKTSKMNRSTEAGAYSAEFCQELFRAIEHWTIWDNDPVENGVDPAWNNAGKELLPIHAGDEQHTLRRTHCQCHVSELYSPTSRRPPSENANRLRHISIAPAKLISHVAVSGGHRQHQQLWHQYGNDPAGPYPL